MLRNVFLDNGAYYGKSVAFMGSFGANSTGLTVTAMEPSSEPIMIGMRVIHPQLDYYCYITQFGTGTGGAGTYIMSSSSPISSGGATPFQGEGGFPTREAPVWGICQEGDGLLPGLAKSAITSINLAGVTAAVGARLFVAGAELVCTSPGTAANQFAPSNGAVLAANLVTAINRASNTATVAPARDGWTPHKVQDAVVARIDPNNGNVLQLMTRAGSAQYNNNPLFSVSYSTTGWTGLSGGPFMFTGGESGAWGTAYGVNVAMWASSIPLFNYGLFSPVFPLAGSVVPGDTIICRAHKRCFGASAYLLANPNGSAIPSFSGTEELPIFITNDDGTVWPVDGPEPVFETVARCTSMSQAWRFSPTINSHVYMIGKRYPSGKNGIRFSVTSTLQLDSPRMTIRTGHQGGYENIDLYGYELGMVAFQDAALSGATAIGRTLVRGCYTSWSKQRNTASMLSHDISNIDHALELDDCVFELRDADAPQLGVFSLFGSGNTNHVKATFRGVTFKGFRPGSQLVTTPAVSSINIQSAVYMLNCDFGDITILGPNFREAARSHVGYYFGACGLFITSMYGRNLLLADSHVGTLTWNPQQDQPCLNARLMDNSSWSYRMQPSRQSSNISFLNPLDTPIFTKTLTGGAGIKRLTANFLMEKGMRWRHCDLAILVNYIDQNGVIRSETSVDRSNRAPLASIGNQNIWTRPLGGSVMSIDPAGEIERAAFNDGGVNLFFEQYQLSLTTRHPVKAGTEVGMIFRVMRSATYDIDQLFVDPDIQIQDTVALQ